MSDRTINVSFSPEEAIHLLWIIEKSSGVVESIDKHNDTWQVHERIQAAWIGHQNGQQNHRKDGEPT